MVLIGDVVVSLNFFLICNKELTTTFKLRNLITFLAIRVPLLALLSTRDVSGEPLHKKSIMVQNESKFAFNAS
jgi:hypothetical protein